MGKITIIEHNSADKDNVRAYFVKGETGSSAYEIAVKNGYTGTEADWISSHLDPNYYYTKTEVDALNTSLFNSLSGDLGDETTARQSADTNLQGAISDEISARQTADTSLQGQITAEVTARETAVSNLQSQVTALSNRSILMAQTTSKITVSGDSGYINYDIPLSTKIVIGNKLTLVNNKVVVGAGVSKVKVSAVISYEAGSTVERYLIIKHGEFYSCVQGQRQTVGTATICIAENLIGVGEGDTISLAFTCFADDDIYSDNDATYITVEVIE